MHKVKEYEHHLKNLWIDLLISLFIIYFYRIHLVETTQLRPSTASWTRPLDFQDAHGPYISSQIESLPLLHARAKKKHRNSVR